MPDAKFQPIPVDDSVEFLPEDKPEVKKQPPLDIVPGASVARPRRNQGQELEGKVILKQINANMFDLTDKEQLAAYQVVLNKIDQGDAVRSLKTRQMPCPELGKWMVLVHWREIDWEKTKAALGKTE